ncbi:antitoxin Xre/MbcA/ParS toxin-binding domain-containing protein [Massilia pseudoviolaceinigra]|uniref:antitoxin Xre/MbcA/ParS toxin-binding domain-containing protein n=1 Tax=Massilia pseudoviolaceinigra TaxID=3057165 RepID=UPI002796911B|nr:antitoxin Xre-like helix-turn-helix domain-containing protein [Massilia sp. CCM 9206]MDQ1919934.1 DUF2384 domain-containing protein [Massilia sp. CCM 9206]
MSDMKAPSAKPTALATTAQPKPVADAVERADIAITQSYRSDPQQRIELIRGGIPAARISQLSSRMGMSKEQLIHSLRLSRAAINRKERDGALLSSDESERVLGVETLIGMVQSMVEESGNPEGFDAARWLATWLTQPLPALGGATPASYMDTFEGQKLVAGLLSMMQSGVYA